MSRRRVGLALGRREFTVAGLERRGRRWRLAFTHCAASPADFQYSEALKSLLASCPGDWRKCEVRIALGPKMLSCADRFDVPYRKPSQVELVAGALAEGRCLGETAEELAIDVLPVSRVAGGTRVEALAIEHKVLETLRAGVQKAIPKARLELVTSLPSALAEGVSWKEGATGIACAGEGFAFLAQKGRVTAWRAVPLGNDCRVALERVRKAVVELAGSSEAPVILDAEGEESVVELRWDLSVPVRFAAAASVALMDVDKSANLLRGAKDAPTGVLTRFRKSILWIAASAALLALSAGLFFDRRARQVDAELTRCERLEMGLWAACLPNEQYAEGKLALRMRQVHAERTAATEANAFPSALNFWGELGTVMPNPDGIGMTLESLQLGPDGGRLTGRVAAKPGETLANAQTLENALNDSERLGAAGEFEIKEKEVLVRMRLEYRPLKPPKDAAGVGGKL